MLPRTITRLPLRSLQNTVFSRIPLAAQAKAAFVTRTMASSSDVKTHEVLDSSELKDGQQYVPSQRTAMLFRNLDWSRAGTADIRSKAVDFAGGKVLLSKIKGQVYATSAFCTHVSSVDAAARCERMEADMSSTVLLLRVCLSSSFMNSPSVHATDV